MQVSVKLNGAGYGPAPTTDEALKATGFVVTVGDYNAPVAATLRLSFDEGLSMLNQLVEAARLHHDAVTSRLAETGRLAAFGSAISNAE